ncbi:MAG: YceI family protein [Sciscionella sp.]
MTPATVDIPGYTTGTWVIDPVHSDVSFTVRHLGVAKVRGAFEIFDGEIVLAENPLDSSVTANVDLNSINTSNAQRDNHVRSADFLDVTNHPTLTFKSTQVRQDGEDFALDGELTLHGVTKPITLALEINGFAESPDGTPIVGFSTTGPIDRTEFGVGGSSPTVASKIQLAIEVEAARKQ